MLSKTCNWTWRNSEDSTFIMRSTSGDIESLAILLNAATNSNAFIGRGNNCKLLYIDAKALTTVQKKAIVGKKSFLSKRQNEMLEDRSRLSLHFLRLRKRVWNSRWIGKIIRRTHVSSVWWQNFGRECPKKRNILEDTRKESLNYLI